MVYIVEGFIGMTVWPEFTFEGQKRESSFYKYPALFIHLALVLLC